MKNCRQFVFYNKLSNCLCGHLPHTNRQAFKVSLSCINFLKKLTLLQELFLKHINKGVSCCDRCTRRNILIVPHMKS